MSDGVRASLGTIVLTRFSKPRIGGALPSVEWIDARFDLLLRTALPSLVRQEIEGLLWVVQTATPNQSYVSSLFSQLSLPRGNIVTTPWDETAALSECLPGIDWFLTARLDSDDAFMPSALPAAIEGCLLRGDRSPMIFNFASGYQLDWQSGEMYRYTFRPDRQGPFLAVTNVGREAMLEMGVTHDDARNGRHVVDVEGPQWIQVVHGDNLRNRIEAPAVPLPDEITQAALSAAGIRR